MFKRKRKSHVSIELRDYVMRILVSKGPGLVNPEIIEVPLPLGMIEDAVILDEMALYSLFKEHSGTMGGKNQHVRFFAPDTSILLKVFDHPEDVKTKDLRSYIQMEIGNSIHLPFQEPLVDVHDPVEGDGKAVLFASAREEVQKFMNIISDNDMTPQAADIRALANLRVVEQLQVMETNRTYLLIDWAINECFITIISYGEVEFLRYQPISTNMKLWKHEQIDEQEIGFHYSGEYNDYQMDLTDLILEIERLMNFFKFSLNKGEKAVNEIIMMGDNPYLESICAFFVDNLEMAVRLLTDEDVSRVFTGFKVKHLSLLGLALKEVEE